MEGASPLSTPSMAAMQNLVGIQPSRFPHQLPPSPSPPAPHLHPISPVLALKFAHGRCYSGDVLALPLRKISRCERPLSGLAALGNGWEDGRGGVRVRLDGCRHRRDLRPLRHAVKRPPGGHLISPPVHWPVTRLPKYQALSISHRSRVISTPWIRHRFSL